MVKPRGKLSNNHSNKKTIKANKNKKIKPNEKV
jgi:hypothetical protein